MNMEGVGGSSGFQFYVATQKLTEMIRESSRPERKADLTERQMKYFRLLV
jgi:hypothetical protein